MPRAKPHPLALFSLVPQNARAKAVLAHPNNSHHVSFVTPDKQGLNIGFNIMSKSHYTLASLGRSGVDIVVEGSNISRIQCSFELHQETHFVMLYDRSSSQSTQVYGPNATPFELGRTPRRVVLRPNINIEFGFGGEGRNLFQFEIRWHEYLRLDLAEQINNREDHPLFAQTVEESLTVVPSRAVTRIQTPNNGEPKIRYTNPKRLGEGQFGEVFRVINVDSGKRMAVKKIKWPENGPQSSKFLMLKREVETLARISHENIIEYISAQGRGDEYLEIFMELKKGNIESLIREDVFRRNTRGLAVSLLGQMLQAIDYLAFNNIVHRDIKPANILYTPLEHDGYRFQLTDFGLCNVITDAKSYAGSPIFMAPEVLKNRGIPQTSKVDVWSLFVTLAYAMDMGGYREKPLDTNEQKIKAVLEAVDEPPFAPLRDMAIVDPAQRASAAQMLDKIFSGEGRTTPRVEIHDSSPAHVNESAHVDEPALLDEPTLSEETAASSLPQRRSSVPDANTTACAIATNPFAVDGTDSPSPGRVAVRHQKVRSKPSGVTKVSAQKHRSRKGIAEYFQRLRMPGAFPDHS